MTETHRPPACHYDRALGERVTRKHRDDCPTQLDDPAAGDCPAADRGCAPCTAPHCLVCGREHATNDQPDTCAACLGKVRTDLAEIAADYQALAVEAIAGGGDGRLVAAAPIPGGNAAVLHGPMVRLDQMHDPDPETHHRNDPIPPLAVLAQWEDIYRAWFDHTRGGSAKYDAYTWYAGRPPSRATVAGAARYLDEQLDHMANGAAVHEGPDWLAFTRQIRTLRAGLERALHDEQEPERGVECFECGDQLVRRFRDPKRCTHSTPARVELKRHLIRQQRAQDWLRTLASYPELDRPTVDENAIAGRTVPELAAARPPAASLLAAARRPCAKCAEKQGGLDDPRAGRSWECPGCRKQYDVGEYVTAVRRDLIDGGGWAQPTAAAQAATDLVGMAVSDGLVRKWATNLTVASACAWRPPVRGRVQRSPQRLVFWPDVAAEANAAVDRMIERRRKAEQVAAWRKAVAKGEDPATAAQRLGISRQHLRHLLESVAA